MDQKISELNSLTTADQADVYPIVDTSASETKKITQQNVEISIANSDNFTDTLIANTNFTTDLAGDTNFTTTLGNNANFISTLTNNATFQTNVNNFVSGGGGSGGGGTKLAIDTTETTVTGDTLPHVVFTIPIPADTLGTNNAIRFKIIGSTGAASAAIDVDYGGEVVATNITLGGNSDWEVNGAIVADNATGAQKSLTSLLSESTNSPKEEYAVQTVDSTVEQDLVVTVTLNNGADTVVVEAIIVEAISTGSSTIDPTTTSLFFDDFLNVGQQTNDGLFPSDQSTLISEGVWQCSASNPDIVVPVNSTDANHPGLINFTVDSEIIYLSGFQGDGTTPDVYPIGPLVSGDILEFVLKHTVVTAGDATFRDFIGFEDSGSDRINFSYQESTGLVRGNVAGVGTTAGTAVTITNFNRFRIVVGSASVQFFLNGTSIGTVSGAYSTDPQTIFVRGIALSGGVNSLDYVYFKRTLTR